MGTDNPWEQWRDYLPQLRGLPLLPVGAGKKFKAPVDPRHGHELKAWQNSSWGSKAIAGMGDVVKCVGLNCAKTVDHYLLILDIDGATAIDFCLAKGAQMEDVGWRILRNTTSDRLKAVFQLNEDTHPLLTYHHNDQPFGKCKVTTKPAVQNPKTDAEQIELFYGTGQCIVLGEHKVSGGHYEWIGSPDKVKEPTPEWWAVIQACVDATSFERSKEESAFDGTIVQSGPLTPCLICGRDHSGACSTYIDKEPGNPRRVNCMKGQSFSPPLEVATQKGGTRAWMKNDKYLGADGTLWEYKREGFNPAMGEFVAFLEVLPEASKSKSPEPGTTDEQPPVINPDVMPGAIDCSGRRQRLAPDEILFYLPHVLGGDPRLNIRSGDVDLPDRTLSANSIGGLYLRLSTPQAVWDKGPTTDALMLLASENSFDPVEEYLSGIKTPPLPIDEWNHLDQCLLGIDDPIARKFLPRYLISAVARIFEPGCDYRQTLVLVGPQWRGKSALGRCLFGRDHWVEGVGDLGRDALMKCQKGWGVELAELDGVTRRADQERLKAFLTETVDTFRAPYDRASIPHPRRFVFWATSNAPPLRDSTGSTRFVTVAIPDKMLPLDWAEQNRDAIWARALQQYRAKVEWRFGDERDRIEIMDRNEDHTEADPWTDEVFEYLDKKEVFKDAVTVTEILDHLGINKERQNNFSSQRVRQIAEKKGWVHGRRRKGNGNRRLGLWPPVCALSTPCPHRDHTTDHPEDGSEASGCDPVVIPDIPKQRYVGNKYIKEVGMGVQICGEKTFDASGVPTPTHRSNPNPRNGSEESGGVAGGVDRASGVTSPKKPSRPFMGGAHEEGESDDELYQSIWSEIKSV